MRPELINDLQQLVASHRPADQALDVARMQDHLGLTNHAPEMIKRAWRSVDGVVIATSSQRKREILVELLRLMNGLDLSPAMVEHVNSAAPTDVFDHLLQIPNGNGAANRVAFLGYLYNCPVFAVPQAGELHSPDLSAIDEARNKARYARTELESFLGPGWLYIGLDGQDQALKEVPEPVGYQVLKTLTKPSSSQRPAYPGQEDAAQYRAFIHEHMRANHLTEAEFLESVVGIVLASGSFEASAQSQFGVEIPQLTPEKIDQLYDQRVLDPDAAGWGLIQRLLTAEQWLDLYQNQNSDFQDPELQRVLNFPSTELAPFLVSCQILGVPAWIISELIGQWIEHTITTREGAYASRTAR